ncbi:hypothetical protein AB833_01380 [Chromatiales bacterium (ex Bugula neritina AB1)]|nr:hypothetical protein AB833_01380 [Chromatiales bacterium (ex Bugula neritina AB1)]
MRLHYRTLFLLAILLSGTAHGLESSGGRLPAPENNQQNAKEILRISWPDKAGYNPFTTAYTSYEIWHNGSYLTSVDQNSVDLRLAEYPQLVAGCLQIRAVRGNERSELSQQSCYSFAQQPG